MKRLGRHVAVLVAAAVVVGLVPVSPASGQTATRRAPSVGAQYHGIWGYRNDAERVAALDKLAAAGVRWLRFDVSWASLQDQGPNTFNSAYVRQIDFVVNAARARGFQLEVTLFATPNWANGGRGTGVPPNNLADYARVARWAAARYRGRVAAWEVWNEPNHPSFWNSDPTYKSPGWYRSAALYAQLLKVAYPQFKAGDPAALVVMGAPEFNDYGWIWELYAHGVKPYFDVMATNAYQAPADLPPEAPDDPSTTRGWRIASVVRVHDVMKRYGDGGKQIWFNEIGWSSHPNTGREANWQKGVTEQQQAEYLLRALRFIGCNFPNVTRVFWYRERNQPPSNPSAPDLGEVQRGNYGLLTYELAEKPVYRALRSFLAGPQTVAC